MLDLSKRPDPIARQYDREANPMIERKIIEASIANRPLRITIDDNSASGGGTVVSSVDGNHVLHLIDDDTWLLRDAAAIDGTIAIIHKNGDIRPLTDEERSEWTHEGRVHPSFKSAPAPEFKVGEMGGEEVKSSDVPGGENGGVDPIPEPQAFEPIPFEESQEAAPVEHQEPEMAHEHDDGG
jgi:hypothetical protein